MSMSIKIAHPKEFVKIMKALAHEDRIKIVCAIYNDSHNVTDIGKLSGILQPSLSAHLRVIHNSGLISQARKGKEIYYTITNPTYITMLKSISAIWCKNDNTS